MSQPLQINPDEVRAARVDTGAGSPGPKPNPNDTGPSHLNKLDPETLLLLQLSLRNLLPGSGGSDQTDDD